MERIVERPGFQQDHFMPFLGKRKQVGNGLGYQLFPAISI